MITTEAGWIGRDAILMTGINALCYVASSIPPYVLDARSRLLHRWFLMDRAGRRPILLTGAVAMAIALTATGWWIYIDQAITPQAVVVCVVIYNAAFGMSWGPVPWLYPPEIMPLAFRAKGVSISTATVGDIVTVLTEELAFCESFDDEAHLELLGWCDNASIPRTYWLAIIPNARILLRGIFCPRLLPIPRDSWRATRRDGQVGSTSNWLM